MCQLTARLVRHVVTAVAVGALVAACGGDDDDAASSAEAESSSGDESSDEAAEEFADAMGAGGGGGNLVFDGQTIAIDSVTCFSDGDDFSVGTVSDNGYRVLIDSSSTGVPNAQVLDADLAQWSPVDRGESVEVGDGTYSSPATNYFDIRDSSREVEVSFTIECP